MLTRLLVIWRNIFIFELMQYLVILFFDIWFGCECKGGILSIKGRVRSDNNKMQGHLEMVNLTSALDEIIMIFHKRLIVQIKILFLDDGDKKFDFGYIFVEFLYIMNKIPYLIL